MSDDTSITILHHQQIDKVRYNACVNGARNSMIYARSFYLDAMCPGWSALVGNNYSWVMPLPINKKWNIKYIYQPPFTQQLGVFALPEVTVPYVEIVALLKAKFPYWQINVNYSNAFFQDDESIVYEDHVNYILELNADHQSIASHYTHDLVKNLKRCKKYNLYYQSANYIQAIEQYQTHYGSRMKHVTENDYKQFTLLCKHANENNMLVCRKVINNDDKLMAIALLLKDEHRIYNLMNTTTVAGRPFGANHFLLDSLLQEFANSNLIFDFEGSELDGVRQFYENFNPINQPYFTLTYNGLPWPLRLFK